MYKDTIVLITEDTDVDKRLDQFLNEKLEDYSRAYLQKLIKEKHIVIENIKKIKSGYMLKEGQKIIVNIPEDKDLEIEAEDIPIDIIYEDEYIVIINKASNIVVHPAPGHYKGTLVNAVLYHIKDLSAISGVTRPGIVHRLDKNTSGVIVIAKNDEAHRNLVDMFKESKMTKNYLAIVKGKMKEEKGRVETLIGRDPGERKRMTVVSKNGKNAITNYEVLDYKENYSLLRVNIETGRTHQIRVHMKYLNNPVVGDDVYGRSDGLADRQMLHSYRLEFLHPITSKKMDIIAELPEDFKKVMRNLGLEMKVE